MDRSSPPPEQPRSDPGTAAEPANAVGSGTTPEPDYRQLFRDIKDVVFRTDAEGRWVSLNPAWRQLTGTDTAEALGRAFTEHIHPDDQERCRERLEGLLARRQPEIRDKVRYRHRDGSIRWAEVWARAILDATGAAIGVQGMLTDVTDFQLAQQALESISERHRSLIAALAEGVVLQDGDGRILACNPAAEEILQLRRDMLTGLDSFDRRWQAVREDGSALGGADHPAMVTLRSGEPQRDVIMGLYSHGAAVRWLSVNAEPLIRDGESRPYAVVSSFVDVTALREQQCQLQRAKESAERANHAKSEFLSRMSHELRTPLNAILGFGQLLQFDAEHRLNERDRESVGHIVNAGRHLLGLINDVLDLSRIEAGSVPIELQPVALPAVIQQALQMVESAARKRLIAITQALPAQLPAVKADPRRLLQVLSNLLDNAIKYNRERGTVLVAVELPEAGWLRVAVRDSGPGLHADQLAHLFEPFNRLGAETSDIEGSGIGLVICRHLIEAMQGRLELASTAGQGTKVWFDLPLAAGAAAAPEGRTAEAAPVAPAAVQGTVLYVEDNAQNQRLVALALKRLSGVRLLLANTGSEGLALARRERPDLVLMDVHLPDISGVDVAAQIAADPQLRDIPVVGVSADAMGDIADGGRAAGFAGYLTKPFELSGLLATVTRFLEPPG